MAFKPFGNHKVAPKFLGYSASSDMSFYPDALSRHFLSRWNNNRKGIPQGRLDRRGSYGPEAVALAKRVNVIVHGDQGSVLFENNDLWKTEFYPSNLVV